MLGFGWQALRLARNALRHGRLEEAEKLLSDPALARRKQTHRVHDRLVQALIERGERHLRSDDPAAAWQDLLRAERFGLDRVTAPLRKTLTRLGLAEARAALEAGKPGRAADVIAELHERGVRQPELTTLEEAAVNWGRAQDLADRGEFAQATRMLEGLHRLLPDKISSLEEFCTSISERAASVTTLLLDLHTAATGSDWRLVLQLTEQILALAPNQSDARKMRQEAWRALEPDTIVHASSEALTGPKTQTIEPTNKYLLWIDGVGGFLICLGNQVSFGQAVPANRVDVPIFADVSRRHALLRRDGEGYTLEALRSCMINSSGVEQKSLLRNGDRVTLGTSCQMIFLQPAPLSGSARLELVSGHRLKVAVDAILLMADTLVIGPGTQAHVHAPDLPHNLVLYRQKDCVGIRSPSGALRMNGQEQGEKCVISTGATVTGEDFSLTLEPVSGQIS